MERVRSPDKPLKIASLLPSATEMVYALGRGGDLVAVSHECDFPEDAKSKPKAVKNTIPTERLSSADIDREVARSLHAGHSIYALDLDVLGRAKPDLILTQELCDVCAVTGSDLHKALKTLNLSPRIVEQTPSDIAGILEDILSLSKVLGVAERGEDLVHDLRNRMQRLRAVTARLSKPRVYAMEWLDPPYAAGHWVPELVALAGGREVLGEAGKPSRKIEWRDVAEADPEVVVLMPCGFTVERARKEAGILSGRPEWKGLSAVKNGEVYAVDANAYFSRPGPRTIEGAELLAHIFHPGKIPWEGPPAACKKLI